MLESSWALRWASTLRSSSESPSLPPTAWVATTIAMTISRIPPSAAAATGRDQRSSQARAASLLGFKTRSAPLVEVELGQRALDHLGGHLLGDLEVAGPHRDVIERDDAREAIAIDDRQPPHPVLDHQRRRLVELHLRLAADQRSRGVVADLGPRIDALGEDAHGEVAVGDHRHRRARRIDEHDRADPVAAHLPRDRIAAGQAATIANRGGFSAWIGGAGWSGLEGGAQYLFTTEAVRRLVAHRDQVVASARWSPGAGIAAMWQTILNGFTFGRNVALGAFGRSTPVPAEKPWQRNLDGLISVVVALPVLLAAVPLELIAAALRRGGAISLRFELLQLKRKGASRQGFHLTFSEDSWRMSVEVAAEKVQDVPPLPGCPFRTALRAPRAP